MATDYDAPRNRAEDEPDQSTTVMQRNVHDVAVLGDDLDPFEAELDLPGIDLDASDLTMKVLPKQAGEFTCSSCYLVAHRSQLADPIRALCRDCSE